MLLLAIHCLRAYARNKTRACVCVPARMPSPTLPACAEPNKGFLTARACGCICAFGVAMGGRPNALIHSPAHTHYHTSYPPSIHPLTHPLLPISSRLCTFVSNSAWGASRRISILVLAFSRIGETRLSGISHSEPTGPWLQTCSYTGVCFWGYGNDGNVFCIFRFHVSTCNIIN